MNKLQVLMLCSGRYGFHFHSICPHCVSSKSNYTSWSKVNGAVFDFFFFEGAHYSHSDMVQVSTQMTLPGLFGTNK